MKQMETTVCPWCQTEIVWDEEIGPEEECPHCHNELEGYRTLNVTLGDSEEELEEEEGGQPEMESEYDWDDEQSYDLRDQGLTRLPSLNGDETDLLAYESGVSKILEQQDQMPECPHCREYMVHTGEQLVGSTHYEAITPAGIKHSLLEAPFRLNMYVCPSCFHTGTFLSGEDRGRFAAQVQKAGESN
jgi:ribosomal protein L37AE/L43A